MATAFFWAIIGTFSFYLFGTNSKEKQHLDWFFFLIGLVGFGLSSTAFWENGRDAGRGTPSSLDGLEVNWTYLAVSPVFENSRTWVLKRPDGEFQLFQLKQKICKGALYTAKQNNQKEKNLVLASGSTCS